MINYYVEAELKRKYLVMSERLVEYLVVVGPGDPTSLPEPPPATGTVYTLTFTSYLSLYSSPRVCVESRSDTVHCTKVP